MENVVGLGEDGRFHWVEDAVEVGANAVALCGAPATVTDAPWPDLSNYPLRCFACDALAQLPPLTEHSPAAAHHEAGHAVVALVLGFTVNSLTIVRGGQVGGVTSVDYPDRCSVDDKVVQLLAGRLAEERFAGEPRPTSGLGDDQQIDTVLDGLDDETQAATRDAARLHCLELLSQPGVYEWVCRAAQLALETYPNEVSGEDLTALRPAEYFARES